MRAFGILVISGFVGATLIRFAPGFGIDAQEIDPRRSQQNIEALRETHVREQDPLIFYVGFLRSIMSGDAGQSTLFQRPVADLIGERIGTTSRAVVVGLLLSWATAILLATATVLSGRVMPVMISTALSALLLSVPSTVIAIVCILLDLPPAIAVSAVVFPRIFPYLYEELRASSEKPHIIMARARGLSSTRLYIFHIVPTACMPVIALLGVSVTLALGASIPVEAMADSPGLGQLTWRAALGRDLPLLVTVTLILTSVTVFANLVVDLIIERLGHRRP